MEMSKFATVFDGHRQVVSDINRHLATCMPQIKFFVITGFYYLILSFSLVNVTILVHKLVISCILKMAGS
jgi:hypothetical protein